MSGWTGIIISVVLVLLNAFFVAAEFALIAARRTAVEARAEAGSRAAARTLRAMGNVSVMMAGAQLGITLCSLGLGAIAEPAIANLIEPVLEAMQLPAALLHPIALVLALILVVFVHVVYGEMVPKNIALAGPERAAIILATPLMLIVWVLKPAIVSFNALANVVLRLFGVTARDEVASAFTRDEVAALVAHSHREGLLETEEHQLVTGVLDLDDDPVTRIMLPLAQLRTVPSTATAEEVVLIVASSGFSRLPVRGADGALVGYVHLKDLLEINDPAERITDAIRPLVSVAANEDLADALASMRTSGAHLAVVRDEHHVALGVLALEDVLEELVGEIRDGTRPV
jgi:CBS domain containing-hemolysin-like protein